MLQPPRCFYFKGNLEAPIERIRTSGPGRCPAVELACRKADPGHHRVPRARSIRGQHDLLKSQKLVRLRDSSAQPKSTAGLRLGKPRRTDHPVPSTPLLATALPSGLARSLHRAEEASKLDLHLQIVPRADDSRFTPFHLRSCRSAHFALLLRLTFWRNGTDRRSNTYGRQFHERRSRFAGLSAAQAALFEKGVHSVASVPALRHVGRAVCGIASSAPRVQGLLVMNDKLCELNQ
eukprot:scaffold2963_cov250-Pinguiococcus_pyrenoidosus.AAC.8